MVEREEILILGIGKLGICFALNLEKVGYKVIGLDVSEQYVKAINDKTLTSYEPQVEEYLQISEGFEATTDIQVINTFKGETIFIMVATPSLADGGYDHSQVNRVLQQLKSFGKQEKQRHLVIGCTVMPGYCDSIAEEMTEYNYTVSYNPEFIAQGSIIADQQKPDQVLIGEANVEVGDKVEAIYRKLCHNEPAFCRMDRLSAEICKLATNCFLTMKISFANSLGDMARKAGADESEILSAIGSDSRIGAKYLKYGFGFGGPCFPRDNRALQKFATEIGQELPLSGATDEVNEQHLRFQVEEMLKKYHKDETIVVEGVAYKEGTSLIDESQQLKLAVELAKVGRKVTVVDSEVVITQVRELYGGLLGYKVK